MSPTASNSCSGGGNGPMDPPPAGNPQSQGLKTYFKTPEGRCKLHLETHPSSLFPLPHAKSDTQITVAQLKERPAQVVLALSSSYSARGGVRHVAAKLLGSGNDGRGISSVGRNGMSKANGGASGSGFLEGLNRSNSMLNSNFDGKGTYLLFNVGDTLYVCDLNSQNKEPIKAMYFSYSNPVCHTFDSEAKDGHDLLIGLTSGDVYSVSLRQQLQDVGKKLLGTQHYNKAGSTNNRQDTRLLLWDLSMDEIAVPLRWCHPGGFPTFSTGSQSAHRDNATVPEGNLQPSPRMRDVPKLSPLVAQSIHPEPLSGLIFTQESIVAASWDGHMKIWMRPTHSEQLATRKPFWVPD